MCDSSCWLLVKGFTVDGALDKDADESERQGSQTACRNGYGPHYLDCESLSFAVENETANQYCHSQLQMKLFLLFFTVAVFFFRAIQTAVTVTNASQSIVGGISKYNGVGSPPQPPHLHSLYPL